MSKTVFEDGNPVTGTMGTIVTAAFLNALNNHHHTGRDVDGEGALDYAVATGAANAYAIALSPVLDAYIAGMPIVFKANHDNTGAATLAVNGMDAKTIKRVDVDIDPGDIKAGQIVCVVYDGTNFQILNPPNQVGVPFLVFTETPPNGTLEADGASLLRSAYPALFAKIGTLYGTADADHFNLPDMRGRFPRIWAHGSGNDPDRATRTAPAVTGATLAAGDHVGTEQTGAVESHQHNGTTYGNDINTAGKWGAGNSSVEVGTALTSLYGGNETRPINTAMMMVIRY